MTRRSQTTAAAEAEIKATLVDLIRDGVHKRAAGNQSEAARIIGLPQPDVSRLLNGSATGFSVWRLMRILMALGTDVTMTFSDSDRDVGNVTLRRPEA